MCVILPAIDLLNLMSLMPVWNRSQINILVNFLLSQSDVGKHATNKFLQFHRTGSNQSTIPARYCQYLLEEAEAGKPMPVFLLYVLFIYVWWALCVASSFQLHLDVIAFRGRFLALKSARRHNVFDNPHKSSPGRSGPILNAISCFAPKK